MQNLLIVHHGRPHFEVILALFSNLRESYNLTLWSNALNPFDRRAALSEVGLGLYKPGEAVDIVIVVSGDVMPNNTEVAPEIFELISRTPTVRICHRWHAPELSDELFLFIRAEHRFVPVSTGLDHLKLKRNQFLGHRQLLIQGNVENRRNYALVPTIAERFMGIDINICGLKTKSDVPQGQNILTHMNLSELDFHRVCANMDFITPLVDPVRYSGYFKDRATSSLQIGFSYCLPFIAHRALFDLCPIVGLAYESDGEFLDCIERANSMTFGEYELMVAEAANQRKIIEKDNLVNVNLLVKGLRA
jgi:hypothetical protein